MAVSLSGMTLHTDNDNETWSGTDDPDDYNNCIQGTNSESWQVSKNSTETAVLSKSSSLPTTRGLVMFWMSSNLAPYYTSIKLLLESSSNNNKQFTVADSTNKAIGGNFVASVVDYVNKGTETGTFAPASFSNLEIEVNNSSSGNIRSVINNWIDAIYYGAGHTISGTTADDELFKEATAVDELTANKYGILQNYNGIIYSQGDLDCSGTSLVSDSEVLVFVDTLNGYDTYNFDITGTVSFKNTTVIGAGTIDFILDAESATSFSMTGGALTNAQDIKLSDGQTFSGVVINNATVSTIANDPDSCTWNSSGLITVSSTGSLTSCTFNDPSGTAAVSIATLDRLDNCIFNSSGTGYAVDLSGTAISSNTTMSWDNTSTGYADSSGNRTIKAQVDGSALLTINNNTGDTLYVENSGTSTAGSNGNGIEIVTGQRTMTFELSPTPIDYEYRIYTVTAKGSLAGASEVQGSESESASSQSYTYSYSAGVIIAFQLLDHSNIYEESVTYYELADADVTQTINLKEDTND